MKYLIIAFLSLASFGAYAHQVGSGTVGSSASGPTVECQLPNGDNKYIPVLTCKSYGGKY